MTARERWQALQTSLTAARTAVERGDTAAALVAVDAALELDPNFLAAHSLRDRIVAGDMPVPRQNRTPRLATAHSTAPVETLSTATFALPVRATVELSPAATAEPSPVPTVEPAPTAMLDLQLNAVVEPSPDTLVTHPAPAEGYTQFERRMRRRRVDGRIDAARQAIERKHVRHAAAALDEVIELDPNLPELSELTVQFDQLRRSTTGGLVGPWLAAGAVFFAGSVFGATTWLRESSPPLVSQSVIAAVPLLEGQTPSLSIPRDPEPAATTGAVQNVEVVTLPRKIVSPVVELKPAANVLASATVTRPPAEPVAVVAAAAPPAPRPQQAQSPQPPPQPLDEIPAPVPPPAVVAAMAPRPVPDSVVAAVAPVSVPPEPNVQNVDEPAMVTQTLQRYRRAYDGLDAQSAHAVWPAVNQAALARAFDGLQSQKITFDACDVRVSGEAATATCQGSARYVPKIGNREPRTESRVWNFTLHKTGADWKIDSARAERN